jgi:hypothetical protein
MIAPVSATLANVDAMKEEPLTKALAIGFYKAGKSMLEPFISESIYVEGMLDIFTRKGEKVEGGSIWNERDSFGNKFSDATNYLLEKYSPGNYPALKRILKAFTGEKVRGKTYKLPDELLGFFGTRKATLNIPETMNFFIGDFQSAARDESKLIYKGTLYGDRVNDTNQVIQQYIFANQQRLETFNKMRRQYDAAMVLGMNDREIRKLFDRRGELPLYKAVKNNKFKPFDISDGYKDAYKRNSIRDDVPNPLDRGTLNTIKSIKRILKNQQLNQDFLIDSTDWLREPKKTSSLGLGELPNTPMPNSQVIQTAAVQASGALNQGLTATENALLSEEEKQIKLRSRGLA